MNEINATTNHAERAHARLSASRIERVGLCPGSLQAEEAMPPQPAGDAAARGTMIHELAELIYLNKPLPADAEPEGVAIARGYVQALRERVPNAKRTMIELNVTEALQTLHAELGGMADFVGIGGGQLTVCDLKTGRIPVDPVWNPQLLTYALGAALALKAPSTITVRLAIYQPDAGGWNEWTCTYGDLMDWGSRLEAIAKDAFGEQPPRVPSVDACRYCRAKPVCPALRGAAVSAAAEEFVVNKGNILKSPTVTAEMLDQAELCATWAEAVQTVAKAQIIDQPGSIVGWRMKDGRKMVGWKDKKMAEALLEGNREAWELKSASSVQKMGVDLPPGLIEESRAAASLARVK